MTSATATLFDAAHVDVPGQTPAWVLEVLHAQGLPSWRDRAYRVRAARAGRSTPRWCHCGRPVITGLAWPTDIALDPTPTTVDGELFALLTGRRTAEITDTFTRCIGQDIDRRRPELISTATPDDIPVFIEHECAGPFPIPNEKWRPPPKSEYDRPPF